MLVNPLTLYGKVASDGRSIDKGLNLAIESAGCHGRTLRSASVVSGKHCSDKEKREGKRGVIVPSSKWFR